MENVDTRCEYNSNFIFNFHVRLLLKNLRTEAYSWGKERIQIAYVAGPEAFNKNQLMERLLSLPIPEDISIDYKLTWEATIPKFVSASAQLAKQGYKHYDTDDLEFKADTRIFVPQDKVDAGAYAISNIINAQSKVGFLRWTRPEDIRKTYEAYTNGKEVIHAENEFIRDHWWV